MFAGDMVTLVFFSLIPIGIPVIFMLLHVGVSFIQTYIFVLLATVYIGEAVAHEHQEEVSNFESQVSSRSLVRYWPFELHLA